MRETRLSGSEGGGAHALPTPIGAWSVQMTPAPARVVRQCDDGGGPCSQPSRLHWCYTSRNRGYRGYCVDLGRRLSRANNRRKGEAIRGVPRRGINSIASRVSDYASRSQAQASVVNAVAGGFVGGLGKGGGARLSTSNVAHDGVAIAAFARSTYSLLLPFP